MSKCLIYEDEKGFCRILLSANEFKGLEESEASSIQRLYFHSIPSICEFFAVDFEKIPTDLSFRDAWKKGDKDEPIKIPLEKALKLHRSRIKEACDRKIDQLNKELEIAEEDDHLPRQVAIKRTKKILRTLYDMNLTHCKTWIDVKKSVPVELYDVWPYYPVPA